MRIARGRIAVAMAALLLSIGVTGPVVAAHDPGFHVKFEVARALFRREYPGPDCPVAYLSVVVKQGLTRTMGPQKLYPPQDALYAEVVAWGESGCETPMVSNGPLRGSLAVDTNQLGVDAFDSAWAADVRVAAIAENVLEGFVLNLSWTSTGDRVSTTIVHDGGDRSILRFTGASVSGTVTDWFCHSCQVLFTADDVVRADIGTEMSIVRP